MKIVDVTSYPVRIGRRIVLLVRVDTDHGVHGWGESGLTTRERAVMGAVAHYASFLVGRDARQIGSLWQEMYRSQYYEGGRVLSAAISAIDMALHDIKGKALGVPVYELLGGAQRDRIPTFASTAAEDLDQMIDLARTLVAQGWTCCRLAISSPGDEGVFDPWPSLTETARWMTSAREALGPEVNLGLDYHHRLSVAEAASFCQRMPPGTLDFLEEPIRDETPGAYQTLRGLTTVPFAIGEEFSSKWAFLPYIESGLAQYARLDLANVGGFTEAMKVAGWCEAHYVDLMPHNALGPVGLAATIQFAAAVPNLSWLECRDTPGESLGLGDSSIFPDQPTLEGVSYPVPTRPGLGIEVDQSALHNAIADSWDEVAHLRRSDGSHTNW